MLHPCTEVRVVNDQVGRGVFATADLPMGTITYAWDSLELEILPDDPRLEDPALAPTIERYSYIDPNGVRILSWDDAKYVNHCCQCNTMSTAYGFEIAIRDISAGEEITDEYGMFNLQSPMAVHCAGGPCRKRVESMDLERNYPQWDRLVQAALKLAIEVEQPLWHLLDVATVTAVERYARWNDGYRSVQELHALGRVRERLGLG